MRNGDKSVVSDLFGVPGQVEVERGLAEFRGGRPVRISGAGTPLIALPVDGIDARRLTAFLSFVAPIEPQLVITARRARALGLDAAGPVRLALTANEDIETIYSLIADADVRRTIAGDPAGPAATAALELASFAPRIPPLLRIDAPTYAPALLA